MKIFFISTIFALLALGLLAWVYMTHLEPVSQSERTRYITVEDGMSARDIASQLYESDLIQSRWSFMLYIYLHNQASDLQAGFYRFSPAQSTPKIAASLTQGDIDTIEVRIPSGVTLDSIQQRLQESGLEENDVKAALEADYDVSILQDRPDQADLEGYLHPETYIAPGNTDAETVVEMVLTHTDEVIDAEMRSQWREQGLNIHEGLTLASIVQREVADPQEQRQVAQVFLRRLEEGMKLEADPTYMYAAEQTDRAASPELDSPYNTYQAEGLPPGPIANAEMSALEAVADPATSDYLYFVTGEDGVTRFSEDLNQHERYIDRYGISGT